MSAEESAMSKPAVLEGVTEYTKHRSDLWVRTESQWYAAHGDAIPMNTSSLVANAPWRRHGGNRVFRLFTWHSAL
jgi:hypothetical protein